MSSEILVIAWWFSMIKKLRVRFILVAMLSFLIVLLMLVLTINWIISYSYRKEIDSRIDILIENDGIFPVFGDPGTEPIKVSFLPFTPETRFMTRYFVVYLDDSYQMTETLMDAIFSVTEDQAISYAQDVLLTNQTIGWYGDYRYKVVQLDSQYMIVFVDAFIYQTTIDTYQIISFSLLAIILIFVSIPIIIFSKKVVLPIAKNHERQKVFITNASHELKTPLTIIQANTEIMIKMNGDNEWLKSIMRQSKTLTNLVNKMIEISKLEEPLYSFPMQTINLSSLIQKIVTGYEMFIHQQVKTLKYNIEADIMCLGNQELLSEVVELLIDNAMKYCSEKGEIVVSLYKYKKIIFEITNPFDHSNDIDLEQLFDRFYRQDPSRQVSGSYGLGLSIARQILQHHRASIKAFLKEPNLITFVIEI